MDFSDNKRWLGETATARSKQEPKTGSTPRSKQEPKTGANWKLADSIRFDSWMFCRFAPFRINRFDWIRSKQFDSIRFVNIFEISRFDWIREYCRCAPFFESIDSIRFLFLPVIQSCTSKGIGRQGIGSFCKEFICFSTMLCRPMPSLAHFRL